MFGPRSKTGLAVAALALVTASVGFMVFRQSVEKNDQTAGLEKQAPQETLGLMTSLPLYWQLDADFGDLASGKDEKPWQRSVMETRYAIEPLDTLSPIAALSPGAPDIDPLDNMAKLAVIQPRGLSPADNFALDGWVRDGGQLLLVLDPMLTGEYDLPLGDPRRPADTALIPPVLERWGMKMTAPVYATPGEGTFMVSYGGGAHFVSTGGVIEIVDPAAADCEVVADGVIARCNVGDGTATIIADAAIFEFEEAAGQGGGRILDLLDFALP